MAYTKTNWVNNGAPPLSAANLNKIEQGISDCDALATTTATTLSNNINYSTSEVAIGTWIDGKTLYRKVYKITSGLPGIDAIGRVDVSDLSIDRCVSLRGWTYSTTFGYIDMYFYNTGFNMIHLSSGNTQITYKYHWDTTELYIVLEYTKTS